ncbi:MAG TPA: prepilin-type N-terminal cleavage/methylation domain-containing protein [Polyangiales bacterium]|nr:prepilin-type N-terminal cleavage/methylation domain-containing protein [Polyangiales bacterium]
MSRRRRTRTQEGMTLIEIIMVTVILALAVSGVSFSLGALTRTNLKGAAGKLGAAIRYAYNRAITQGTTVRVHFNVPGSTFSIEEAHNGVMVTRARDKKDKKNVDSSGKLADAVDPWAAAQARISQPDKPTVGASPFSALTTSDGEVLKRYQNVALGRGVQIIRLIVAHEPEPVSSGEGAVHFFPGGRTERAVIQLGDGRGGVYSVELHPLTGRVKVHAEAYEPKELLQELEGEEVSEVRE